MARPQSSNVFPTTGPPGPAPTTASTATAPPANFQSAPKSAADSSLAASQAVASDSYLPAPYGKACAECVKTKRKCMLPPNSGECQRCHRLHKTCHRPPATGVRKRATPARVSRAALEEKLENLVNLLQQKSGSAEGTVSGPDGSDGPTPTIISPPGAENAPGAFGASAANAPVNLTLVPQPTGIQQPNSLASPSTPVTRETTTRSPSRATLQDLAEASASASSVRKGQQQQQQQQQQHHQPQLSKPIQFQQQQHQSQLHHQQQQQPQQQQQQQYHPGQRQNPHPHPHNQQHQHTPQQQAYQQQQSPLQGPLPQMQQHQPQVHPMSHGQPQPQRQPYPSTPIGPQMSTQQVQPHQHQQPQIMGSALAPMNQGMGPTMTQPVPVPVGVPMPVGVFPQQPQMSSTPHISSTASTPQSVKRAVMPNIFNPAKEFLTASMQDNPPKCSPTDEIPPWMPREFTPDEEASMLDHFRREKSCYFPFIYIPPEVTPMQIKSQRPFLWLTIMAVSSKVTSVQLRVSQIFRDVVAKQLLMDNETSSLDMLQGLLVYLAWSNYHMHKNLKPFMCMYAHMAMAIIAILSMTKPQNGECIMPPVPLTQGNNPYSSVLDRDLDEKRAALGCYYITSTLSSFLHVGNFLPMRWMPYMDEYLADLNERRQSPLDDLLVAVVKCQLVTEAAVKLSKELSERGDKMEVTTTIRTMQYKILQSRLDEVKTNLPQGFANHHAILLTVLTAETAINEAGCWDSSQSEAWLSIDRVAILSRCFAAIKGWFDLFFQLPLELYPSLPFTIWCQMFRNCCILCKLSTVDDKGWDRAYVRQSLDLLRVIDRLEHNFLAAPSAAGIVVDAHEGDVFTRSCRPLKHMRKAWERHLVPAGVGVMTPAESAFDGNGNAVNGMNGMGAGSVPNGGGGVNGVGGPSVAGSNGAGTGSGLQDNLLFDFGNDFDWFADLYSFTERNTERN